MGDRPEKCLEMGDVMDKHCRGCFKSPDCVCIYFCNEGTQLFIKFVLKVFYSLGEEDFGDEHVRFGGIVHCLDVVRNCLCNGPMCMVHGRVVGVHTIYAFLVGHKDYAPPEYARKFV